MSKPRLGAAKRLGIGLLAGALSVFGIALAPHAGAISDSDVIRYAGTNRYGTAAAISGDSAFSGATNAIVATGENYPDALAASALAGANAPTPIILTQKDTYTTDAKNALKALGVKTVTIVGGTAAVSSAVQTAIEGDGYTVTRQAGADRYETASKIATATNAAGAGTAVDGKKTALIATGLNFPDALSGGPGAYSDKLPLLLVGTSVPAATKSALTSMGIQQVVILGGTAAVSDAVETELEGIVGNPAVRAAGTDRFGTAAEFGKWEIAKLGYTPDAVVAATGMNFPDALAAGPLGGEHEAPIVLTASCPQATIDFLKSIAATVAKLYLSGGTAVIDDATKACLQAALAGSANATATDRPELISSKIVSVVKTGTIDNPTGAHVDYVYDETVQNPTPGDFDLFHNDGSTENAGGGTATVDASNDHLVHVVFPGITDSSTISDVTLGGSQWDAVEDVDGNESIEGSAPVSPPSGTAAAAHKTNAPDLLTMSRVGSPGVGDDVNQRAIDITFDQNAYSNGNGNWVVAVLTDGSLVRCYLPDAGDPNVSGNGDPGGDGTSTMTALCDAVQWDNPDSSFTAVSTSNVARVSILANMVGNDAAITHSNVQQSTTSPDGNSTRPDLTGVTFAHGTSHDTAVFTFSRTVVLPGSATDFHAYTGNTDDGLINNNGDAPILGNGGKSVEVHFASGDLDNAVGGIVDGCFQGDNLAGGICNDDNGAGVVAASGSPALENAIDEEGATSSGATAATAGSTLGPDLTAFIVATSKDSFGNPSQVTYIYTFDKNVDTAGAHVGATSNGFAGVDNHFFFAWQANGDAIDCGLAATNADNDQVPANSVACATITPGSFADNHWDDSGRGAQGTNSSGDTPTLAEAAAAVAGSIVTGAVSDTSGHDSPEAERVAVKVSV